MVMLGKKAKGNFKSCNRYGESKIHRVGSCQKQRRRSWPSVDVLEGNPLKNKKELASEVLVMHKKGGHRRYHGLS